jgi:cysteine sulfinate desulfinase/cysteine desulfurase-like protein
MPWRNTRARSGTALKSKRLPWGRGFLDVSRAYSEYHVFCVSDIDGETLVIELDRAGFAVASGAACSSTSTEPSATLLAMGIAPEVARGAVRISFGAQNTASKWKIFCVRWVPTVSGCGG